MSRRHLAALALLILGSAGCDLFSVVTDPADLRLSDVSTPPPNHATVVVTEDMVGQLNDVEMTAGIEYFFQLRTPPPLPELLFDTSIPFGQGLVRFFLDDVTQEGVISTEDPDVSFLFTSPSGNKAEPTTSCRITITSAWSAESGSKLTGQTDCPVTGQDENRFRVLVKFDYTVE